MGTRRAFLLSSAALAAARALPHPAPAFAQDATPAAAADPAAALLGEWSGAYAGFQRGEPFAHEVTFVFTMAHGRLAYGKQLVPQEDGTTAEEATGVMLLPDGRFIGADTDGLKFGSLLPDGSLYILKLEASMDDGAFYSILRKDGQPAPAPAPDADAASLVGRWQGTFAGYQQGEMTSGLREITITDTDGPAFAGAGIYKVGDNDWSPPGLTEGILGSDGRLYLINTEGYMVGEMIDDDTMRLAFMEAGMDNAALIYDLHRQSAKLLEGATPAAPAMPAMDLMGCWSGPGESFFEGVFGSLTSEFTFTEGKDGFYTGTHRWKLEDGDWYPVETFNAAVLPDGMVVISDEDSYHVGQLMEDGTFEIALVEPHDPGPLVAVYHLTRQC